MRTRPFALLVAIACLAGLAAACGIDARDVDDPCPPVDPGGECFVPSDEAFRQHARASADAWPQLAGMEIVTGPIYEAQDRAFGGTTWLVPLLSQGEVVAASRFIRFDETQVRLAEVALYVPVRPAFLEPKDGETLVLFPRRDCGDPIGPLCAFQGLGLAILQEDGRYRLGDGTIVVSLPG